MGAVGPAFHPAAIIKLFIQNHSEKSHGEGRIGTRSDLEPMLGPRGKEGKPGINGDDLGAFFHEINDPVTEKIVRTGCRDIITPDNHAFRYLISRIVVAFFKPLAGIEYAEIALNGIKGGNSGTVAGIAGKGEHDVGASEGIGQHTYPGSDIPAGTHGKNDRFRAVRLPDFFHACLN